jgi:hypothetical protein
VAASSVTRCRYRERVASDPLISKILLRLRTRDAMAAGRAQHAVDALVGDGGLADLTQHDLQAYLWFTLPEVDDCQETAVALASFLEMAELHRYAGIAGSTQTKEVLRTYLERGQAAGIKAGTKAMDASGVVPPDMPELEWGELMGPAETDAYDRIAATLELALAAGEMKPGARGWRSTQQRLTRHQLTMARLDGPPLLDRVRAERVDIWVETGGTARRALAAAILGELVADGPAPADAVDRMAPMQWLLELASGRAGDPPGVPLTVVGNLARWVVQEGAERFGWWDLPERPPRSESDIWRLGELRLVLGRVGALRRSGRRLVLGTRGRALLGDPGAQWIAAMTSLIDMSDFDCAVQEAALMLLVQARGMAEIREVIREVAEIMRSSGWRDTGNGAPPEESDVSRAVWGLIRRCQLWSMVEESKGPGYTTRVRLSEVGRLGGLAALRHLALRPRMEPE